MPTGTWVKLAVVVAWATSCPPYLAWLTALVKTGVYPADWGGLLSEPEGDFGE